MNPISISSADNKVRKLTRCGWLNLKEVKVVFKAMVFPGSVVL
jgi:hypothetical protein